MPMRRAARSPGVRPAPGDAANDIDALIVGAGPTGLALAARLLEFGASFRIIDRLTDRTRESRALAVQARTLEQLQAIGLGERLAAAGNASTRLRIHFEGGVVGAELGGFRAPDTRFPFILFISQAETEALLGEHLAAHGVVVERGVELTRFHVDDAGVACTLRRADGGTERVRAAYLAGCDGAHSTVRKAAGIAFEGGTYLQDFMLGDVDADGPLEAHTIHSFPGGRGVAMFFPLGAPRAWRVIAMAPGGVPAAPDAATTGELTLGEIQSVVDAATGGRVRLRNPAWLTHFRLHHRQTARYRQGRIFLAGDAAHIHSPVGGQGMNTGIQDAWNLGWKLALVARGRADPALLDTYDAERWPVGRALLRTTDRAFGLFTRAMASSASAAWLRRVVVPRVLRRVLRSERIRSFAFGFISELRIRYRDSPLAVEGTPAPPAGPRAGDRMPDARVTRGGRPTWLQQQLAGPHLHLLLCGPPDRWDDARLDALVARHDGLLHVHRLTRDAATGDALVDATGTALERLGADDAAQYLVRPDGYIAYRQAGRELDGIDGYLARWFDGAAGSVRA